MSASLGAILSLAGAAMMVAALYSARGLARQIEGAPLHRAWRRLTALTVVFVIGYVGYAVALATRVAPWRGATDAAIVAIFVLGAAFVWQVFRLAFQTVVALQRVALLERESITDHLTGVYNRRFMDRRLREAADHARRHRQPLAFLLLDLDHFKRINDTYGHAVGDLVLREFGARCLACVRSYDIVARYGGEELAVIAPTTDALEAGKLAERLRSHVAASPLVVETEPGCRIPVRLTVSVGVAAARGEAADPDALIAAADAALYDAKRQGRNRVVVAPAS